MFSEAFSGYSVSDIAAAKEFYGTTLGLTLEDQPGMGFALRFTSGHTVFIYEKSDHIPADFTVLNFPVKNIDDAVQELVNKDITLLHYDNLPAPQDDAQILRGLNAGYGPDIAWFNDPAGNVLAVLQQQ